MSELFVNYKKWLVLALAVCSVSFAHSQSVDSILHNGEQFYVYPFRKAVEIHDDYWKVLDDDAFFEDYNNFFNHFPGDFVFSREKFQKAKTQKRKEDLQKELEERWKDILSGRKFGKSATRTIRERPGELIEVSYDHDKDVLPPFGNIPDGKYVQLFEDICLVDENGKCQSDAYQIAGYFTIKNNVIDGKAVWLDFKGDTLKHGNFVNGLKEGEWEIKYPEDLWYSIGRMDRKHLRKGESIYTRYTYGYETFKNGLNHGAYRYNSPDRRQEITGEFELGLPFGEWSYRTNERLTLKVQMADAKDTVLSRKPILREESVENPRTYRKTEEGKYVPYEMDCRLAPMPSFPNSFYEIQFRSFEEEIELEGENEKSFDLTDARRSSEYDEFETINREYRYDGNRGAIEVDPLTGATYPRWYVMDSLGAKMKYDGVYEQYYMNGQLFFRYEFKNGQLLEEDTLFWDNGNLLDVIVFEPDSNKYFRSLFARDGRRYDVMIYDSLGQFIQYMDDEPEEVNEIMIDGILAEQNDRSNLSFYDIRPVGFVYVDSDTLSSDSLTGKVLIARTWSAPDTTIQMNMEYDPLSEEYTYDEYNCFGESHFSERRTYTEDFTGWTGTRTSNYGEFKIHGVSSGIRNDWDGVDTLNHESVFYRDGIYDVSSDANLYRNDELYTGKLVYKWKNGMFKLKSSSGKLTVSPSAEYWGYSKFYRAQRHKKRRKRLLMESVTNDIGFGLANEKIGTDFLEQFLTLLYDDNGYFSYSGGAAFFGVKSMEGQFLDGKAHGLWTAYDQKGEILSTLNFTKGEPDGELRMYNYQAKKPRHIYYYAWTDNFNLDSFPKRRTRYLEHVVNYKNGLREGTSVKYDWLGRIMKTGEFQNDLMDGKMISRDLESHTEATFKNGMLDGYLRTYLTFPKRDSILLYDINLQNGMLNGESKSYHTNGRLAKRGFFLDGEPIEDYEAYDTLGFKYHYVQFEYGMPVEEKIWEENALSIRYQFDWKDSIEFHPDDITSTQSVEALLVKEGYINYSTTDKYYGRGSLISKEEIECQMTKYYPNDTIARDGRLQNKQKIGLWKFYGYDGTFLYEANYFDSVIVLNDSIKFKSKGILTDYDDAGNRLFSAYIIEKFEKYDCAHTDHYEVRQLLTIDEENDSTNRMNGHVYNFYDNGTLQSEGSMKNGIPNGLWKFYDPYGELNKMGNYTLGKRDGRWLEGDLAKKKYLGEICMNPNLPDLEEQKKYQENLLDITIINYMMGKLKSTQFYDVNMNRVMEIEESKAN